MQKHQLDMWLHGDHKDSYRTPKVYVIGCSDIPEYLLAVEYKHKLEPVKQGGEPVHFGSLDQVKEEHGLPEQPEVFHKAQEPGK